MSSMFSDGGTFDIGRFSVPSLVKRCIEMGFRLIELGLDMGFLLPGSMNEKTIEELVGIKETERISYTVHLPLYSIEPASPNEFIRKASVEVLAEAVRLCEPLKPEAFVIHATGATAAEFSEMKFPSAYRDFICDHISGFAETSIKELLQSTKLDPGKLAIENIQFPYKFMKRIIDEYDLSTCFDTGHLLAGTSGDYTIMGFLEDNFNRIIEIHLHDGYHEEKKKDIKILKDHLPLGEGKLPIVEMFDFLKRNEYSSPLIFELPLAEAIKSLQVIHKLFPSALESP